MRLIKYIALVILFFSSALMATDVTVDASEQQKPNLRKIFDAFRAVNNPPENRLREIESTLVRMFVPLTDPTGQYPDEIVTGTYPDFTYHFELADSAWVGPIIAQGSQLNLGYCYMPSALGDHPLGPPRDWEAWQAFNYNWALHYHQKYNIEYFEIWNEPDYSEFFIGSQAEYFQMYRYAVQGIREAVPEAKVGGPALAGSMGWIPPFLDFVLQNELPLDFISYHSQDNGYNDTRYYERYQTIISALDAREMEYPEIHLNEFSYEISPAVGSSYDRSQCAAWFAGTFKNILTNMPGLTRFNKTIIDNDEGDGKWENNGLINLDNTPKAKFNLFKMYALMPDSAVGCEVAEGLGAMASARDSSLAVMIWNKSADPDTLNLTVENMPFEADSLQVYLIDPQHSSHFDNPESDELEIVERIMVSGTSFSDVRPLLEYSVVLYMFFGKKKTGLEQQRPNQLPTQFGLDAYPNPFNAAINILVDVNKPDNYDLTIYNILGKKVDQIIAGHLNAGNHHFKWNRQDTELVPSGVYFLMLENKAGEQAVRRIILLK